MSAKPCESKDCGASKSPGLCRCQHQHGSSVATFAHEATAKATAPVITKPPLDKSREKIQIEKKTKLELVKQVEGEEEGDLSSEPVTPHSCPSEYSLSSLNNELSILEVVRAFNSAEGKRKSSRPPSKTRHL
ncbi:unnamed protein product [Caenorhabditis auriculariae]|uniref:Uncharacterized protein n=1 Tax=Caenorhabditis auriculariae TaxID=2777116 RepID=A0A8S1H5N7_9PELO|nr:unnamed protein product [Caenorhabditis auriculariae]